MGADLRRRPLVSASALSTAVLRSSFALNLESQDFQGSFGKSLPQEPGPVASTVILISDNSVIEVRSWRSKNISLRDLVLF